MGVKTGKPRGRPRGAKNLRTRELEAKMAEAARVMQEAMPGAFQGNAHDFLMFVYKNPDAAMKDRLAAATAAAPYEKPKLSAIEHSGSIASKEMADFTDEELAALAAGSGEGTAEETASPPFSH